VMEAKISNQYTGKNGTKYFNWQKHIGELGGKLNLLKFRNFISEDTTLCDFGCGGGFLLDNIHAKERVGVEINEKAFQFCRSKGLNVYNSIEELPNDYFDLIISNHALEHIPNPYDALGVLKHKLKKHGRIAFCLPIDDWRAQKSFKKSDINNHLYTWTPQLIGNLFTEVGYHVTSVRVLKHAWSPKIYDLFGKPMWVFNLVCYLNSVFKKRYQIIIVGEKKD